MCKLPAREKFYCKEIATNTKPSYQVINSPNFKKNCFGNKEQGNITVHQ